MERRKHWKESYEYRRILEILDFYWLSQPNELKVRVSMDFVKADGQTQRKTLIWLNPNYEFIEKKPFFSGIVRLSDVNEQYFMEQERAFWNTNGYRLKEGINSEEDPH